MPVGDRDQLECGKKTSRVNLDSFLQLLCSLRKGCVTLSAEAKESALMHQEAAQSCVPL